MEKLFHDFVKKEEKNTNTTVNNYFCERLSAIIQEYPVLFDKSHKALIASQTSSSILHTVDFANLK